MAGNRKAREKKTSSWDIITRPTITRTVDDGDSDQAITAHQSVLREARVILCLCVGDDVLIQRSHWNYFSFLRFSWRIFLSTSLTIFVNDITVPHSQRRSQLAAEKTKTQKDPYTRNTDKYHTVNRLSAFDFVCRCRRRHHRTHASLCVRNFFPSGDYRFLLGRIE